MMNIHLQKKVSQAVKLLQVCYKAAGEPLEIAYSGGKDSDVILELAKMAGIEYQAIYKNTTIDPPGTIKHVQEQGAKIIRKNETFFHLVAAKGFPNRIHRFCCEVLKEYKVMDNVVMGIRRCESTKRYMRYSEPTECRIYGSKTVHANAIYPILGWTDKDELDFINERKIKLHPLYYREDGSVDITQRLGCICCPLLYYKKRLQQFKQWPGMVKAYLRAAWKFMSSHKDSEIVKIYHGNVYQYFYATVFFKDYYQYQQWLMTQKAFKGGIFRESVDYKKFLEDYFHVTLPDYSI